jgi:hypothetical protein
MGKYDGATVKHKYCKMKKKNNTVNDEVDEGITVMVISRGRWSCSGDNDISNVTIMLTMAWA